jgi:hypothetical protein
MDDNCLEIHFQVDGPAEDVVGGGVETLEPVFLPIADLQRMNAHIGMIMACCRDWSGRPSVRPFFEHPDQFEMCPMNNNDDDDADDEGRPAKRPLDPDGLMIEQSGEARKFVIRRKQSRKSRLSTPPRRSFFRKQLRPQNLLSLSLFLSLSHEHTLTHAHALYVFVE